MQQAARHFAMSKEATNRNKPSPVQPVTTKMIRLKALAILAFQPLRAQVVSSETNPPRSAKTLGQKDDITVVTLQRLSA